MNNNAMSPLVTIAIPAYKRKYLKEAIQSVLEQSYKNLEVVIVNDCSPQDLDSVLKSFEDDRIHYYFNRKNLGKDDPAHNWNKCLSYAHGDLFSILCDDDMYEPTFVERMVELAQKYQNVSVFRSRADFIDKNGVVVNRYPSAPEWESMEDYMWHVFNNYRYQTISEFMCRRERILSCGGYVSLPLAWYADYLSIYRFSSKDGIASCSDCLVHFRQSGDNISSQDDKNTLLKLIATHEYEVEVGKLLKEQHVSNEVGLINLMHHHTKRNTKYSLRCAPKSVLLKLLFKSSEYGISSSWAWEALFSHRRKK